MGSLGKFTHLPSLIYLYAPGGKGAWKERFCWYSAQFPSLCPACVFSSLGFSSLLLPDKVNLTAYDIMLKILNWMLPYGSHCINDCCMGEIWILQWPSKIAGMSFSVSSLEQRYIKILKIFTFALCYVLNHGPGANLDFWNYIKAKIL